jgi:hypothetical protein
MKALTPAAMHAMATSARQLGELAPAVASIFDRLASDPAMSAVSSNPDVEWLNDVDVDVIASFTAHATVFVNAVIDNHSAARKASRQPGAFTRIFSKKGR